VVPGAGIEPACRVRARDFKSLVSTDFTTRARVEHSMPAASPIRLTLSDDTSIPREWSVHRQFGSTPFPYDPSEEFKETRHE
jgi:hypothetical protein